MKRRGFFGLLFGGAVAVKLAPNALPEPMVKSDIWHGTPGYSPADHVHGGTDVDTRIRAMLEWQHRQYVNR